MTLTVGKRATVRVETLEEASAVYERLREESGEGASTFPDGRITGGYRISYNGRVWRNGIVVCESASRRG